MKTAIRILVASMVLAAVAPLVAWPQLRRVVTVQELIDRNHRLEVATGTEVVWGDPHFGRVWFPSGPDAPVVERADPGFRTLFKKAGTYRGSFTIVGGHRSDDVYPLIVTVTDR